MKFVEIYTYNRDELEQSAFITIVQKMISNILKKIILVTYI